MQAKYMGFYFSIVLNEESRLKNVFWEDNRCMEVYKEFGDVVTFDTTYLTNKYDMPFAPFVWSKSSRAINVDWLWFDNE